jgi:DNA primase
MSSDDVMRIKEKIDIVALIGERVNLKKAGRNFKGLCPFHGEKSPSFFVSPEMQMYKCFGCQEAGDVIAFLERYEG